MSGSRKKEIGINGFSQTGLVEKENIKPGCDGWNRIPATGFIPAYRVRWGRLPKPMRMLFQKNGYFYDSWQ